MSKASKDFFVHEIALNTIPQDERELDIRLEAGRQLYNACLGECLRQIALIWQSHLWQKAKRLSKSSDERKKLFQQAKKAYGYSEYNLHAFVAQLKKSCWLQYHIDSSTAQKIATRAFAAADEYMHGKKGRPRLRGCNRLHSIEGKSNAAGMRWKENHFVWKVKGGKSLKIPARFDLKDKQAVQANALQCPVKYCRLVRKTIRGRKRWCLQLVLEFQHCWGRSVGARAPGMFVSMLRRKAERAGGIVEEFSTYHTCLSQSCHCGLKHKKKLSERWHRCTCGIYAQRGLFSAHLARHVHNERLDTSQAAIAWTAAEMLLEHAVSRLEEPANRKARLSSFGLGQRKSRSHAKEGSLPIEAADVVSKSREPRRDMQLALRTLWL